MSCEGVKTSRGIVIFLDGREESLLLMMKSKSSSLFVCHKMCHVIYA
jgi:hypothetical protein